MTEREDLYSHATEDAQSTQGASESQPDSHIATDSVTVSMIEQPLPVSDEEPEFDRQGEYRDLNDEDFETTVGTVQHDLPFESNASRLVAPGHVEDLSTNHGEHTDWEDSPMKHAKGDAADASSEILKSFRPSDVSGVSDVVQKSAKEDLQSDTTTHSYNTYERNQGRHRKVLSALPEDFQKDSFGTTTSPPKEKTTDPQGQPSLAHVLELSSKDSKDHPSSEKAHLHTTGVDDTVPAHPQIDLDRRTREQKAVAKASFSGPTKASIRRQSDRYEIESPKLRSRSNLSRGEESLGLGILTQEAIEMPRKNTGHGAEIPRSRNTSLLSRKDTSNRTVSYQVPLSHRALETVASDSQQSADEAEDDEEDYANSPLDECEEEPSAPRKLFFVVAKEEAGEKQESPSPESPEVRDDSYPFVDSSAFPNSSENPPDASGIDEVQKDRLESSPPLEWNENTDSEETLSELSGSADVPEVLNRNIPIEEVRRFIHDLAKTLEQTVTGDHPEVPELETILAMLTNFNPQFDVDDLRQPMASLLDQFDHWQHELLAKANSEAQSLLEAKDQEVQHLYHVKEQEVTNLRSELEELRSKAKEEDVDDEPDPGTPPNEWQVVFKRLREDLRLKVRENEKLKAEKEMLVNLDLQKAVTGLRIDLKHITDSKNLLQEQNKRYMSVAQEQKRELEDLKMKENQQYQGFVEAEVDMRKELMSQIEYYRKKMDSPEFQTEKGRLNEIERLERELTASKESLKSLNQSHGELVGNMTRALEKNKKLEERLEEAEQAIMLGKSLTPDIGFDLSSNESTSEDGDNASSVLYPTRSLGTSSILQPTRSLRNSTLIPRAHLPTAITNRAEILAEFRKAQLQRRKEAAEAFEVMELVRKWAFQQAEAKEKSGAKVLDNNRRDFLSAKKQEAADRLARAGRLAKHKDAAAKGDASAKKSEAAAATNAAARAGIDATTSSASAPELDVKASKPTQSNGRIYPPNTSRERWDTAVSQSMWDRWNGDGWWEEKQHDKDFEKYSATVRRLREGTFLVDERPVEEFM